MTTPAPKNGCHDRRPYRASQVVQDGWFIDGVTRVAKVVSVPVGAATIKADCAEVAALRAALAEPAPVQEPAKKGLFVDLIAQHPGLAENLMAIDAVPLPEWKPPPRLTDADVNKIYNKWVMGESDGTTFTDAIQTAVRKQFGVNVEAAPQASESVLTNASAQQPAPPADVPMLTEDEIIVALHVALPSLSYDSEDAFISGVRAGEQAVRQKAGLS